MKRYREYHVQVLVGERYKSSAKPSLQQQSQDPIKIFQGEHILTEARRSPEPRRTRQHH